VTALLADAPSQHVMHLSGVHTRGAVAERLQEKGLDVVRHAIYDQVLEPLTDAALAVLESGVRVLVPLFSPRTAQHFAGQCKNANGVEIIALSHAVAEKLDGLAEAKIIVADHPDASGMMRSIEKLML